MATRTITGTILHADGTAWEGARITFKMKDDTFLASPAATYPLDRVVAITDEDGAFSATLNSGLDIVYQVAIPSGGFEIAIPDGSSTTLEELRADYTGAPTPITYPASDIVITSGTTGQLLVHNGTQFVNTTTIATTAETSPVAASTSGIAHLYNLGAASPSAQIGSIYSNAVRSGFVVARKYTTAGGADCPTVALTAHIECGHATGDGVAIFAHANVTANNGVAFGGNVIARNNSNTITGAKLVGFEIDVEPATGSTVDSDSGGLYINVFNVAAVGPAIQLGSVSSGTWTEGIILSGIRSVGAGLTIEGSAGTMGWGIYLNNGTFTTAAAQMGAQNDKPALILNQGVAGTTANIFEVKDADGDHIYFRVEGNGAWGAKSQASADLNATLDSTSTGRNVGLLLRSATVDKWSLLKDGSNDFMVYNAALAAAAITVKTADSRVDIAGVLALTDGITAPSTVGGKAQIYVDTADGDLKVRFGDGTIKVIVADT